MKRLRVTACLLLFGLLGAVAPSSSVPSEIPGVRHIVISQFVAWQAGLLDRTKYSRAFNTEVSDSQLQKVALELSRLGAFDRAVYLGPVAMAATTAGVIRSYRYRMICAHGTVNEQIGIATNGKIASILFSNLPASAGGG